jgi:hypothetical protein
MAVGVCHIASSKFEIFHHRLGILAKSLVYCGQAGQRVLFLVRLGQLALRACSEIYAFVWISALSEVQTLAQVSDIVPLWYGGENLSKADQDNHSNQLNPNNDAYWESRGDDGRPDDWEERSD